MQTGKKVVFVAAGLVCLLAAGAFYMRWTSVRRVEAKGPQAAAAEKPAPAVAERTKPSPETTSSATGHTGRAPLAYRAITPSSTNGVALSADEAEAEKMEERLEEDDFAAALAIGRKLMRSKDPAVRSQVVTAFGWIGIKALPELSTMLADESKEIAAEAFQKWKESVDEVADEAMKSQLLVVGMQALSGEDELESCVMEFDNLPEDLAVRGLVTVIQSQNPIASEVAKDHYDFVTGEEYSTPAAAETWIEKNFVPPQPAQPEASTKK